MKCNYCGRKDPQEICEGCGASQPPESPRKFCSSCGKECELIFAKRYSHQTGDPVKEFVCSNEKCKWYCEWPRGHRWRKAKWKLFWLFPIMNNDCCINCGYWRGW